jgi:hypothetical protein
MADQLPMHVALVSEMDASTLTVSELTQVSAALSKQVSRDFGPIWGVNATVDAFPSLDDVPAGYWPVIVKQDIGQAGAAGFHTDKDGNPFALVEYSSGWSLTASHETLEMLADPYGNRVVASTSPSDHKSRVEILVEVCDPSEDASFGYAINGITVSDFYTPRFLDPLVATGVRYSYTNAIKKPLSVLKGGYISFHDLVSNHWKQVTFFGAKPKVVDLGVMQANAGQSIREQIDRRTPEALELRSLSKSNKMLTQARGLQKSVAATSNVKAEAWRAQIRELTARK